jgi:hypothetical protein
MGVAEVTRKTVKIRNSAVKKKQHADKAHTRQGGNRE